MVVMSQLGKFERFLVKPKPKRPPLRPPSERGGKGHSCDIRIIGGLDHRG